MLYMAGGDHLPVKLAPSRQVIGPRPPVPPMPTANFFTLGRIMMQSAFASTPGGMSLVLTIACNTVVAFLMVSSSLLLSAPNTGSVELIKNADVSKLSTTFLLRGIDLAPPFVRKNNRLTRLLASLAPLNSVRSSSASVDPETARLCYRRRLRC